MFANRSLHKIPCATIALIFILFSRCTHAQQCPMAHDPKALKSLQERATAGDADAQCGLGKQYEFALGVPQDDRQAALWLQKSAEQGNLSAEVELGVVFSKMQDFAQALIWYRKAAEKGSARAEYNLAVVYKDGEGVPKDFTQAMAWYRKAADHGDMLAESNMGVAYEHGTGVPQDYAQAASWYRKAAEQGLAEAQYGLGYLYFTGNGAPKDAAQAAQWMRKAAEQGETRAQYNLGSCYINGEGVDRDLNEGYFWIFVANVRTTESGLKAYSEDSLGSLNSAMKKSDIKSAQRRAQEWLKEHPPYSGPP
jgi:uncharacterized protein